MKPFSLALCIALALSGCARNMSSNTYTSSSAAGLVLEGTVVSARAITIKESDQLQNNTLGGLAGGALGGVGASSVGKGSGNAAATVGGVVAGAVVGALVQDQLGTSQGMEYVVKLDKGEELELDEKTLNINRSSNNRVQDKLKNKIKTKGTNSRLISVVQGNDVVFVPGQRVYVIYSDDRPRLASAD